MTRLTRSDVVAAYELLLGRLPESEAAIATQIRQPSVESLIRELTTSPEFSTRWKSSRLYNYAAAFDVETLIRAYENRTRRARPGHIVNFLGVAMNVAFMPKVKDRADAVEGLPIPANWHADMSEFAAVLRAVDLAQDRFVMIELGCGWGCWMINSGVAAKRRKLRIRLIGVEGDAGHIAFAREALETNGIAAASCSIFHGIAGPRSGVALFPHQERSGADWGLEPRFDCSAEERRQAIESGAYFEAPIIALANLIGNERRISLLHMDIQGGEALLVRDCLELLTERVAYLVIGTHSRAIEGELMAMLLGAGWKLDIERPSIFEIGEDGPVTVVDGVQGWRNDRLYV